DDVAPLDGPEEQFELLLTDVVLPKIQLDSPALVLEVGKDRLAMVPDRIQPAGGAHLLFALLVPDSLVSSLYRGDGFSSPELRGIEGDPGVPQLLDLLNPLLVECKVALSYLHGISWSSLPSNPGCTFPSCVAGPALRVPILRGGGGSMDRGQFP